MNTATSTITWTQIARRFCFLVPCFPLEIRSSSQVKIVNTIYDIRKTPVALPAAELKFKMTNSNVDLVH